MIILPGNSVRATGYDVANSLRFESGSSDHLSLLYGSSGNRKTFTFSTWVKRDKLGVRQRILGTSYNGEELMFYFENTDQLYYLNYAGGGAVNKGYLSTTQLFRDTTAWLHIVLAIDTTQSTASDRLNIFINGKLITDFTLETYPSLNDDAAWISSTHTMYIGAPTQYFSGYLAETITVDGQQLDATSFGEFDSDSPTIWKPKDVSSLTFGSKGFYLDYEDSSALGNDVSGNNNDWTVNNLTAVDQSLDTCTNNFATYNNLLPVTVTFSNGNLTGVTSSNWECCASTISVTQGKWYCEINAVALPTDNALIGVEDIDLINVWQNSYVGHSANGYGYWSNGGQKYNNNSASSYGNDYGQGDTICIALDMDNKRLYFRRNNNASENSGNPESGATGTGALSLSGSEYVFVASCYTGTLSANFGSPPYAISSGNTDGNGYGNFEYAVPSGYYSLNTKNLAEFG